MPRTARVAPGGMVFHALNRAVARLPLFQKPADYGAFVQVLDEALERHPTRVVGYCLMPNHWHFVLWPREDGELTEFLRWLTHTHTMRWHAHYQTSGSGHLYQGRFKAFPVQSDEHLLTVLRYVERNALRASLVARAEDWAWSSALLRATDGASKRLTAGPVALPSSWLAFVNRAQSEAEILALRRSVVRGTPFGSQRWQTRTARRLGLTSSLRPRGRPMAKK